MNKYLVSIAAGAAALVAATGANAATNFTVGSAYSNAPTGTTSLENGWFGWENDYSGSMGPQKISGTFNGSLINATAFCIELTQDSSSGSFDVVSLSSYLNDLGKSGSYNSMTKLLSTYSGSGSMTTDVALQLAIWDLRYDNDSNVKSGYFEVENMSSGYNTYTNAANAQLANLGTVDSSLQFWVAKSSNKQDLLFVTQTPAVPEPATWAMMIIGFAAIGRSMRARRNSTAVSFA